ncbi:MAG: DUF3105 domain-containing protein [Candidatus Promineifilaceae bacterium]
MNRDRVKSRKYLLCFFLLAALVGLACNTVTGSPQETAVVEPSPTSEFTSEVVNTAAVPTATEVVAANPTSADPTLVIPTPVVPTPFLSLDEAIQHYDNISAAHVEDPDYPDNGAPPPGGPHNPVWQNCGVYTEPVETKHALHSLEHGAVWLTYDPALSVEDVRLLQDLAKDQAYTIMSPYPGLRSPVILTAWGLQFETDTVTDPRILEFLLTYQVGPQTPEPGAPCQGGTGLPKAPSSLGS